jgi:phosphoribosylformylglycinamidine cyclo-ligase
LVSNFRVFACAGCRRNDKQARARDISTNVLRWRTASKVDADPESPPVFGWLRRAGAIAQNEMLATFNCGIGMVAVVAESQADELMLTLAREGEVVTRLGRIVDRTGTAPVVYRGKLQFT